MTCFAQDSCFKLNFRQLLSRASLTHIMSRKPYLSSESKAIALNVVKIYKKEKLNGQLFVPLCRPVARASLLTGIPELSLNRFASMSNGEKTLRKPRSNKIVVDVSTAVLFDEQLIICWCQEKHYPLSMPS